MSVTSSIYGDTTLSVILRFLNKETTDFLGLIYVLYCKAMSISYYSPYPMKRAAYSISCRKFIILSSSLSCSSCKGLRFFEKKSFMSTYCCYSLSTSSYCYHAKFDMAITSFTGAPMWPIPDIATTSLTGCILGWNWTTGERSKRS